MDAQISEVNIARVWAERASLEDKKMDTQKVVSESQFVGGKQADFEQRNGKGTDGNNNSILKNTFRSYLSTISSFRERIVQKPTLWYKKCTPRGIFRRHVPLPAKDGRHIELDASRSTPLIDERTGKVYINNAIRSSRYTIWSFIPAQLWFQFSKIANFFFLVTAAVQLIPGLSTTGNYSTVLPLVFFLSFSIAREGYDDFRRYRLDRVENRRLARALYGYISGGDKRRTSRSFAEILKTIWKCFRRKIRRGGKDAMEDKNHHEYADSGSSEGTPWATVGWIDLKVGDIVELNRDEKVPADIVLLHSDGRNGIAYIETMALDGETNLKSKQPPHLLTEHCATTTDISTCRAHFVVEEPNINLYEFNGNVSTEGKTSPLTLNNIVYRGSTLRNTIRVVGMVINTGEECKIRMNANRKTQTKAPVLQTVTNRVVVLLMVFVILLSIACTAGYEIWTAVFENNAWYLAGAHLPLEDISIGFAIEFNNLIPLALYVSLEIIKFAQFVFLNDIEMYDPVSDTPMVANTQTIIENLGQINYVFSDKTGTLTENIMRFRKMSVAGTSWLHNMDARKEVADEKNQNNADQAETKEDMHRPIVPGENSVTNAVGGLMRNSSSLISDNSQSSSYKAEIIPSNREPTPPGHPLREFCTDDLLKYLRCNPRSVFTQKVRFFLLSLAICHTCFPEVQKNGSLSFQAVSPDELALVEVAQDLGYIVIDRTSQSITLLTYSDGHDNAVKETYEVLDVIEFSSKRKRMSVIVKFPNGKLCIFCKGADSVIQPRLKLAPSALEKVDQAEPFQGLSIDESAQASIPLSSQEQNLINSYQMSSLSFSIPGLAERDRDLAGRDISDIELDSIYGDMNPRFRHRGNDKYEDAAGAVRRSTASNLKGQPAPTELKVSATYDHLQRLIEHTQELDEASIFELCLKQTNDFACEGLRTLVYGYRFINDEDYTTWNEIFQSATTSLTRRQEMIELAGELIERDLNLAGATAIEDKLQKSVPETIDKLQRANIKIWMLTGDKRETAINIAHSTRICRSHSNIIILDHEAFEIEEQIRFSLHELKTGRISHAVVVIDGRTLVAIEGKEASSALLYELLLRADSVICCRASPCQKAALVRAIRENVRGSITLAIGDGGNDVAMIQEAHVGVGISGKEGLQAARVADYSIAQFRFLQRLLFVHGHWNYVRTAKYILLTFWKEMVFYSVQAMYQRWNGYTGTSLYESDSLVVWNTLFTSLPVMLPGIFEQDLSAATLLAMPELYSYGQNSQGFNMRKYGLWMLMAACESQIIWFMVYGLYGIVPGTTDQGIFAIGDLAFSVCVVFINVKLL